MMLVCVLPRTAKLHEVRTWYFRWKISAGPSGDPTADLAESRFCRVEGCKEDTGEALGWPRPTV